MNFNPFSSAVRNQSNPTRVSTPAERAAAMRKTRAESQAKTGLDAVAARQAKDAAAEKEKAKNPI